jgi:Na+/H+-dicarboxylate symporter
MVVALRDMRYVTPEEGSRAVYLEEMRDSRAPPRIQEKKKFFGEFAQDMRDFYNTVLRKLVYAAMGLLHVLDATVTPPEKLPYLWHLLFSLLAFLVFAYVFVYSNFQMIDDAI